ncbi:MAG: hypothetical protein ACXWYO_00005, partial [Gaiellaceae bacterium]
GVVEVIYLTSPLVPRGAKQVWTKSSFLQALPVVLPADSASPTFHVELADAEAPPEIVAALQAGEDPQIEILLTILKRMPAELGATKMKQAREDLRFPTPNPFGG